MKFKKITKGRYKGDYLNEDGVRYTANVVAIRKKLEKKASK